MLTFFTSTQYSFDGKKNGEMVAIFLHRHWFILAVKLVGVIVAGLLAIFLYPLMSVYIDGYSGIPNLTMALYGIYYMFLWSVFIYTVTMYLLDSWIVTNERILNNTQHGFFNRTIAEMQLYRIQDVSVVVSGLIPTFLNFGNVEIQTAAEQKKFIFQQVPNPHKVKDELMRIVSLIRSDDRELRYPPL